MYFIHEETHYNRSQRTLAKQKRDIPNTTRQRVVKEKQNLKGNEFKHKPCHRVCNFLKPYVFIIARLCCSWLYKSAKARKQSYSAPPSC